MDFSTHRYCIGFSTIKQLVRNNILRLAQRRLILPHVCYCSYGTRGLGLFDDLVNLQMKHHLFYMDNVGTCRSSKIIWKNFRFPRFKATTYVFRLSLQIRQKPLTTYILENPFTFDFQSSLNLDQQKLLLARYKLHLWSKDNTLCSTKVSAFKRIPIKYSSYP
jgi:hypothetical protein